jgi:hypothetical protein
MEQSLLEKIRFFHSLTKSPFFRLSPLLKFNYSFFSKATLLLSLGFERPNMVDPLILSYSQSLYIIQTLKLLRQIPQNRSGAEVFT